MFVLPCAGCTIATSLSIRACTSSTIKHILVAYRAQPSPVPASYPHNAPTSKAPCQPQNPQVGAPAAGLPIPNMSFKPPPIRCQTFAAARHQHARHTKQAPGLRLLSRNHSPHPPPWLPVRARLLREPSSTPALSAAATPSRRAQLRLRLRPRLSFGLWLRPVPGSVSPARFSALPQGPPPGLLLRWEGLHGPSLRGAAGREAMAVAAGGPLNTVLPGAAGGSRGAVAPVTQLAPVLPVQGRGTGAPKGAGVVGEQLLLPAVSTAGGGGTSTGAGLGGAPGRSCMADGGRRKGRLAGCCERLALLLLLLLLRCGCRPGLWLGSMGRQGWLAGRS